MTSRSRSEAFSSTSSEEDLKRQRMDMSGSAENAPLMEEEKTQSGGSDNAVLLGQIDALMKSNLRTFKQEISEEFDKKLDSLSEKMTMMEIDNSELKLKVSALERREVDRLEEMDSLKEDIRKTRAHAIRNEQYSHRRSIKMLGVPEAGQGVVEDCADKVVSVINRKMPDLHATKDDIEVAHRVRSWKNKQEPRSILVKFRTRDRRQEVIKKRGMLRDSGYMIGEDVCKDVILYLNRLGRIHV